jgi:hypothetical protein
MPVPSVLSFLLEALNGVQSRASGQDDLFIVGGRDRHTSGTVDPRVSANEVGADFLDTVRLSGVIPQRDVTVAAAEDALRRNGVAHSFARTIYAVRVRHSDHRT